VLVAVIDADRTIFTLDKDQILTLKKAGITEKVLLKMLGTRREFDTPPASAKASAGQAAPEAADATQATAAAELPGVVIIGGKTEPKERAYDNAPFLYPYFYMTYPIWGAPRRDHHRVPAAPFFPAAEGGFGRFINDGWIGRP
jgi:hypothetical protein